MNGPDQPFLIITGGWPVLSQRTRITIALSMLAVSGAASVSSAQATASAAPVRRDYTEADVQFMQGMIGHHAQAIVMAAMAPTHDAGPQLAVFARKVAASQKDEIDLMQTWLRDRGEKVPDPNDPHAMMHMDMQHDMKDMDMKDMDMGEHEMLMPGMLTKAQLAQLDHARGTEFDRLFLTFMIQHHKGAVSMVKDLFGSYGAAQDETVFKFANDVSVDQSTEIARMEKMLAALPPSSPS
jgi:uncharacterized protein (DUF305 family)